MDLICSPDSSDTATAPLVSSRNVLDVVQEVLSNERAGSHRREQRATDRYVYNRLVSLTPFDRISGRIIGQAITTPCRNLSLDGLGFYHAAPLEARHVLVQFLSADSHPPLLMKLVWCRFIQPGWYDNGGRFVRVVAAA